VSRSAAIAAPIFWCLAAAALFGASTPASKALLGGIGPITLAGLLYLGAALGVLPFARRGGDASLIVRPRNLARLGGAVVFGGVLAPALLMLGLRLAPAGSVSLWLNLESIATALLGALLFREHLTRGVWFAAALMFLASVALSAHESFSLAPAGLLAAAACVCWGLDNNFTAVLDGCTPAQVTLIKGLAAGAFNLGLGLALGEGWPKGWNIPLALATGAIGYGASLRLYVMGAQALGAVRSQMLFAAAPYFGLLAAWTIGGEPALLSQRIAGAMMIAALVVMLRSRHGHQHHHLSERHVHAHRHDDGHHDHAHDGLAPDTLHVHPHEHAAQTHEHPHDPDLHHRHEH
jgi:drug/metabolite transporter (DMT)-like permease